MAIDQRKVMQAIYDIIFDSLTMTPPNGLGRPATDAKNGFLTLAFPGLPIDVDQYADPWSPTHPNGSVDAAESLAWLVEGVPELSPIDSDSGNSVDDLFGQIVRANVEAAAPGPVSSISAVPIETHLHSVSGPLRRVTATPHPLLTQISAVDLGGQSIRMPVTTPLFEKYLSGHAAYDVLVTQYMASSLQAQHDDQQGTATFASRVRELEPKLTQAWRAFDTLGHAEVEDALEASAVVNNSSVTEAFSQARLVYEQGKLASPIQPGVMWHQCLATPANWMDPNLAMASVSLTSQSLRTRADSQFKLRMPDATIAKGLLRIKASREGIWTSRALSQDSTDLSVSFRFARVSLRRLWLNASLFTMDGWSVPGRPKNAFSTGAMTDNDGIFSLLPAGMIVFRDVAITARWATSDLKLIRDVIGAKASLSFGPFVVSGPLMHPKRGASSRFLAPNVEGMTISVPGLSVRSGTSGVFRVR